MKKKLWIILMVFVSTVVLIGCNNGGSDIDINYTEVASTPMNLVIKGKILSWDAVDEAKDYIIYVNEEKDKTVKTNSYDFSSLTGDVLIFQVQTDAIKGFQDSGLSAKLAYVADKAAEINKLDLLVEDQFGSVPSGFSEALVDKGMIADDFENMQEALTTFLESLDNLDGDVLSISEALKALLDSEINYEALINAFILYIPDQIDSAIESLQDDIDWNQEMIDLYGEDAYYTDQIAEEQGQIDMYNDVLTTLENSSDEVVLSILHTSEYFISIVTQLDTAFFTRVNDVVSVNSAADLDSKEVILIKDEIVSAMLDNLPSVQDIVILFELINSFSSTLPTDSSLEMYPTESAAETLLMIEAFAKLIDTIDLTFVDTIKTFSENEDTYQVESSILIIKYFYTFQQENKGLIEEIRTVFSYDQQKALFESYVSYAGELSGLDTGSMDISSELMSSIAFEDFYQLSDLEYRLMDPVLEWFVYTDGAILRSISERTNSYNYENSTLASYESSQSEIQTLHELCGLFLVITGEIKEDDETAFASILSSIVPYSEDSLLSSSNITKAEYDALLIDINASLETEMNTLITLLNSFFDFALSSGFFDDWSELESDINTYAIDKYGMFYGSYENSMIFNADPIPHNARMILMADLADGYFTSSRISKVNDLINMIFDIMSEPNFLKASGMTATEVQEMRQGYLDDFAYFVTECARIHKYNAFDLSEAQAQYLEDFLAYFDLN